MIREVIQNILERFDYAMMDATVRFRLREENLARFGELVHMDMQSILAEVAASDSRITLEEKNRGYFVRFKGHILFRIAVNVFSERAEVVVDRQQIVQYLGLSDSSLDNYGPRHKVSVAIKSAILVTFSRTMQDFLTTELEKL